MKVWDYNLPKNWKPKTTEGWIWFLERKINYGDFKGLNPRVIKKYFRKLKLDPGKRMMFKHYFDATRHGAR